MQNKLTILIDKADRILHLKHIAIANEMLTEKAFKAWRKHSLFRETATNCTLLSIKC